MKRIILVRIVVALVAAMLAERVTYLLAHSGMDTTPPRRLGRGLSSLLGLKHRTCRRRGNCGFSGTYGRFYDPVVSAPSYERSWYKSRAAGNGETQSICVLRRAASVPQLSEVELQTNSSRELNQKLIIQSEIVSEEVDYVKYIT